MAAIQRKSISVAMATYQGGAYIREQLDSILEQTLPVTEIVICDDGSRDETLAIIREYQRKAAVPIRLFLNDRTLGSSKNFEKAIAATTGEIIFLADQDDVWRRDKTACFLAAWEAMPEAGGCFSDSAIVDRNLRETGCSHWERRGFSPEEVVAASGTRLGQLELFLKRVPAAGHDMAFHAELKSVLLPFPDLANCYDTWLGLGLAALRKWGCVNQQLTLFRQHEANASGSGRRETLCGKFREARRSIENNTFAWNASLFEALLDRIGGQCEPEVRRMLEDRRQHSAARAAMNTPLWSRLPRVVGEMRNQRYWRYGRGWANVFQDIFLRRPW